MSPRFSTCSLCLRQNPRFLEVKLLPIHQYLAMEHILYICVLVVSPDSPVLPVKYINFFPLRDILNGARTSEGDGKLNL